MAIKTGAATRLAGALFAMSVSCHSAFGFPVAGGMIGISRVAATADVDAAIAPSYDSNYTAAVNNDARRAGNTPEDDARPGVYFFNLGANAFMHDDYAHAIDMYRVAASWAYKPAEYNLAVIYARGEGVPVDLPRAMAWIALAVERNDKRYVEARELIYSLLTREQFDQANVIWRELKRTYGDEVAMPRAKWRWREARSSMTGSRVGASNGPLSVRINGDRTDGSIAYRQLRESNDPYDPKFEQPRVGIATVGPLTEIRNDAAPAADAAQP